LINTQFTKADAQVEFIQSLIDSGEIATLKHTGELFISPAYLSARSGNPMNFADTNMWSRKLAALNNSPTFPYKLDYQRKRIPNLVCSEAVKQLYAQSITNNQQQLSGFVVTRKLN
jgi:hypothetical protein